VYLAESFLEQQPSKVALEVVENSKIWAISKPNIDKLYLDFPQLNLISRVMIEQYLKKYEGFIRMLRLTPEKRVEWYYACNSALANRVPLKYVATYLQMTPSTLSRARKKMVKRKSV
jgi:CRP-like cAMP-binding protein